MSVPQWLRAFGLDRPPFSKELGADELWVPSSRERVVEAIVEACRERGHVLLTGEPGVGKTCVLRAVRRRLPEAGFRLTYCHNATLGRPRLLPPAMPRPRPQPEGHRGGRFLRDSLATVHELSTERVHPAFLLDEAHLLQQQVLDHLHILANYEWDSAALLSLVLVGLPELDHRLRLSRNRSLWSRIHTRVHLGDAAAEDTAEYIHQRLVRAGRTKGNDLFDSDALTVIHEATDGRLRDIDRIATDALKRAARRKLKHIDRQAIQRVLRG